MSDSLPDLEPPSETLAALLRADRAFAEAAPDDLAARQAQVLARLSATLGPLDAPAPVAPAPPSGAPTPAPPAAAPPPGTSFLASMFTKGGLTMLALGALAGGATTAAVSANAPPAPPVVLAAPATSASFAAPVLGPPSVEAAPARAANETAVPTSPGLGAPSVAADPSAGGRKLGADGRGADGRDPELERERALLDVARGAIARGNADLALRSLDDHRTRFPQGRLTEDREALRIKALVAAGRTNEADRSRAAFVAKYPDSFALPRGAGSAVSVPPEKTPTAKEKHDALTDPFARRQ